MVEVLLAGPPPVSRFTLSNSRKLSMVRSQAVLDVGKGHIKEDLEAVCAVDPCSLVLALRHGLQGSVQQQEDKGSTLPHVDEH